MKRRFFRLKPDFEDWIIRMFSSQKYCGYQIMEEVFISRYEVCICAVWAIEFLIALLELKI